MVHGVIEVGGHYGYIGVCREHNAPCRPILATDLPWFICLVWLVIIRDRDVDNVVLSHVYRLIRRPPSLNRRDRNEKTNEPNWTRVRLIVGHTFRLISICMASRFILLTSMHSMERNRRRRRRRWSLFHSGHFPPPSTNRGVAFFHSILFGWRIWLFSPG